MRRVGVSIGFGLVTAVLTASGSAGAQNHFTGTQIFTIQQEANRLDTLVETQKGNKTSITFVSGAGGQEMRGGSMIVDRDAGTQIMVMPSRKMYMAMPVEDKSAPPPSTPATGSFTKTGQTKTIAGISCSVYHGTGTASGKSEPVDVCIAPGVGFNPLDFAGAGGGRMAAQEIAALGPLMNGNGAIEVVSHDNGKTQTMTLVKVDPTSPSDAQFAPPADYQKFQMPAGMKMPAGMAPGGMGSGSPGSKTITPH
jgi:hypothetical protein